VAAPVPDTPPVPVTAPLPPVASSSFAGEAAGAHAWAPSTPATPNKSRLSLLTHAARFRIVTTIPRLLSEVESLGANQTRQEC
jgi:hypothetical protein